MSQQGKLCPLPAGLGWTYADASDACMTASREPCHLQEAPGHGQE